jgi:leukotriene-A4 hydrolase
MSYSTQFASKEPTQWDEDRATLSNYREVRTDHIDLDWTIDWKKEVIHGGAQLRMTATKDIKVVKLDSSYLDIKKVLVDGVEVKWSHGERIGAMGEGLTIELKDELKEGKVSDSCMYLDANQDLGTHSRHS